MEARYLNLNRWPSKRIDYRGIDAAAASGKDRTRKKRLNVVMQRRPLTSKAAEREDRLRRSRAALWSQPPRTVSSVGR